MSGSIRQFALGALGVVGILLCFEFLGRSGIVSTDYVPPPSELAGAIVSLAGDAEFRANAWSTLAAWATAVGVVGVVGIAAGLGIGSSSILRRAATGVVDFLRPIPSVGLLPAAVLLFGLGHSMKVILAVYAGLWPVLVNTMYGVHEVDPVMMQTARSFRWPRRTVFSQVVLPSTAPYAATGLRLAVAVTLIVVLSAELLVGRAGIGVSLRLYQDAGRPDLVYAGIAVTGLLGLASNAGMSFLERRVLHWSPANRGGS